MISGALSRAVQEENGSFSGTKSNCMAYCFEEAKTPLINEGRNKVVPSLSDDNTVCCKLF